jgi:sigma-54 dependent transcriptional regulator, acetoin dehydrogenase operon transcriptional activator AcoR
MKLENILSETESLKRILENLSEGIIAHDQARRVIFFNRSAEEITGYDRDEVIGKDCHEVFGTPFCGGRCSFLDGSPDSLDRLSYPLNIFTKKGEARRIEMQVTGMRDQGGSFVGVVAAFRDVSDLVGLRFLTGELQGFAGIVGRDPKMLQVYGQIRDLASNDYPVHIAGETGTGKELVACAIHNESRRGGRPFVPINCAALPEGVLESELFGHVKGAFTGAVRDKKGRFELAHGGTVFLDEVADLPKPVQAKLLRVLQEGTFERVGGEETICVNLRIISATNRDLKQEVKIKNFREDLYYRINVVPIHLPPLKERREDIPSLIEHFMRKAALDGQESLGFSSESLEIMKGYSWPGNIRELQSAIHFALVHSKGAIITPEHLPMELRNQNDSTSGRGAPLKLNEDLVRKALARTAGNKAKASRVLGVGRATLYRFIADHPSVS